MEEQLQIEEPTASTWEQQYIKGILCGVGAVLVIAAVFLALRFYKRRKNEAA